MADEPEPEDQLPPAEAARARRRDRDASAAERKGMQTGLAKQFKQVLDAQAKRAREAGSPAKAEPGASEEEGTDRPPASRAPRRRRVAG